ncbi:MAG TPA: outer membrane protein assembly factor BamE [Gemmatimonadota bacterium]|nr:outer membrane protein assembly factor BamE [Gemmatimonadota bacterium]
MRTIRCAALAALILSLAACGGGDGESGQSADAVDSAAMQTAAARTLSQGMTQEEVRNKLGEPRTRVTMDGGLERWTYYNYDANGQLTAKTLIIFGNDSKIAEVNHMSQ